MWLCVSATWFCCRYNDPSYVKVKKLELLVDIATELNVQEIVEELR